MSGPPRYIPSRRSRFRMPDPDRPHRPADVPTPEEPPDPATVDETAPPAAEPRPLPLEPGAETPPGYELAPVYQAVNTPEAPVGEFPPAPLAGPEDDGLPQAFRLRNVYEGRAPMRRGLFVIYATLGSIALMALGGLGGLWLGSSRTNQRPLASRGPGILPSKGPAALTLSDDTQAEIDTAFNSTKEHRYADAQKQFKALYEAHPEWPSMAIENARATLYQLDAPATTQTLNALTRNGPLPDAMFLTALLHLTHKEFDDANLAFASAVALDPARPDFYYFWGDCLRSQGKPRDAARKFQEALIRNQYETAEDLYQLKFWLSLIQADQEEASGLNALIDGGLKVTPRPAYSVVFAAAAREIKKGRFKEAGALFAQGRLLTEPVVFQVILQDPTFIQESWRPELAGFYAPP